MRNNRSILAAFVVNLIVIGLVALGAFAWGYDGTLTVSGINNAAQSLFGGIGAAITWVVGIGVFVGLLIWHNRLSRGRRHDAATALMGVSVFVAAFGAIQLLQRPTSQIWALIGLLAVAGLLTGAMWVLFVHHRVPGWTRFQAWRRTRAAARPAPVGP
jgi:hypothetical protein